MDAFLKDIRYGIRSMLRRPGFTAIAVITLALGIGANTAIFSLTDALLLKMLPVRAPEQLVFLEQSGEEGTKQSSNLTLADLEYLQEENRVLSDVCSFSFTTRINAGIAGQAEMLEGQLVSGNFFSTLGVDAAMGRTFNRDDDSKGDNRPVAVISYSFWKRRFGQNPGVVGQTWILNNSPFTIVGVAPQEFHGALIGDSPDIYVPSVAGEQILPNRLRTGKGSLAFVLGRLKPGVSNQQASASLTLLLQRFHETSSGNQLTPENRQVIARQQLVLKPAGRGFSALRQRFSEPLRFLMFATFLVLMIASANVANLLLASAAGRRKEFAVRLAIGATRIRLIRQLLIESLLLAVLGAGCGLFLASWCTDLLIRIVSSGRNPITAGAKLSVDVPIDYRVLGFTALVAMLTGILFGILPALKSTRVELSTTLAENSRGGTGRGHSLGRFMIVGQIALSLTLLVGAGLCVRSLEKLQSEDVGFKQDSVLLFSVDPQLLGYKGRQIAGLYERMLDQIAAIPGVSAVSLSRQGLLNGGGTQGEITVPGSIRQPESESIVQTSDGSEWNDPYFCQVGPKFFETAGMTILRGRDFRATDDEAAPKVAVVNETFARYYFGNADPIGMRIDRGEDNGGEVEIVGLVKDSKYTNIRDQTPRTFYVSFLQDPGSWRETSFQVRTAVAPMKLVDPIRRELQSIEPNLPIFRVKTLEDQIDESLGQERLVAMLSSFFGFLGLLLACAGLYGVLSHSVSRRTQEIGIRVALGAQRANILRMVMGQGLGLTIVGISVGLIAAWCLTRLISSLLYGVSPTDPITVLGVSLLFAVCALLACYVPARRATKVDPMVALRHE